MTLGEYFTPRGRVPMVIQPITYLLEVLTPNLVLGIDELVQFSFVR